MLIRCIIHTSLIPFSAELNGSALDRMTGKARDDIAALANLSKTLTRVLSTGLMIPFL
jgi:hypothetical protein